jgi:exodeoxyribonuclease V gamma subunit
MLHLVQSNKMEVLVEQCTTWLRLQHESMSKSTSPLSLFEPDTILVQSPGMAQWLKIEIAKALGISSNIQFPLPSSYIWRLYQKHLAEIPETSAFSKDNMTWKLMQILPSQLDDEAFASIRGYLFSSDYGDDKQIRLFELCNKIADIFDQYLVYRPDWILQWENGEDDKVDVDYERHPWQPILWRQLVALSQSLGESPSHRANLHSDLITQLDVLEQKQQKGLAVFGISALPLQQLQVLQALAKHQEVVIFWLNPCQHYWADIVDERYKATKQLAAYDENLEQALDDYLDVGHPLLASWGKLGRDYQDMLLEHVEEQHDYFEEIPNTSLLCSLQSSIYLLETRETNETLTPDEFLSNGRIFPKVELAKNDLSLQLHVCHSIVRELEVLHDQLLHLFNYNPSWHPGDVIVMMPDIAVYAPFIEGVFGSAAADLYIPFAISDRNINQESILLKSFIQLMTLHTSRLTLSEVLDICEVPAVLNRFDISAQEFSRLRHWLTDVGIRWGWDGISKEKWDIPAEEQNSWRFGLQRLMAGYAMQSDSLLTPNAASEINPYHEIEGQQAVALGKFYLYLQTLEEALLLCQQKKTIDEKCADALSVIDKFYLTSTNDELYIIQLRQVIEQLESYQTQYEAAIEQDVFVNVLEQGLTAKGVGQRFLAGKVNFCTLMPMRSIPFKGVCLLGMNDDAYPRQSVPIGFDLMRTSKTQKGDRSRRLDDRYLFLEAILSARECLYISYIGFSLRDNNERNESILVAELVDYCLQHYAIEGDLGLKPAETARNLQQHLTRIHGLQPFGQSYFVTDSKAENNRLQLSYQSQWLDVAKVSLLEPHPQSFWHFPDTNGMPHWLHDKHLADNNEEIEVGSVLQFYQRPMKTFFRHHWQAQLSIFDDSLQQEEPFCFSALDNYVLGERLVSEPERNWLQHMKGEGRLPIGRSGAFFYEQLEQKFDRLKQQVTDFGGAKQRIEINFEIDSQQIVGWLPVTDCRTLVCWRAGKIRAVHKLNIWLQWLLVMAQGVKLERAVFLGTEDTFELMPIQTNDAKELVVRYIRAYRYGLENPLLLFPDTAWEWVKTGDRKKALAKFDGNNFAEGEGREPHVNRVCPDLTTQFALFEQTTDALIKPLYEFAEASDA